MKRRRKLLWARPALDELKEIAAYTRRDNPTAARRIVTQIRARAKMAKRYPRSGRVVPELKNEHVREYIVGNYRVVYQFDESANTVTIVSIFHARRQMPHQLEDLTG